MTTQSEREIADLRALVAEYVDAYGYVGVPATLRPLAQSCRREAVSAHIDREIDKALRS